MEPYASEGQHRRKEQECARVYLPDLYKQWPGRPQPQQDRVLNSAAGRGAKFYSGDLNEISGERRARVPLLTLTCDAGE